MSSPLGIEETLGLLDRLRTTVRAFAVRESKLELEFRSRSTAEAKLVETATRRELGQLDEALASDAASREADRERYLSRFEQRRNRIAAAHRASRRQALKAVEHEEGRRRYLIQKSSLEAERLREAELAAAAAKWDEMQRRVAESRAAFEPLEAAAQRAFRGYGRFRGMLSQTADLPADELPADEERLLNRLQTLQTRIGEGLDRFRRFLLPHVFGHLSVWLLLVAVLLAHLWLAILAVYFGVSPLSLQQVGVSAAVLVAVLLAAYQVGQRRARPAAAAVAADLAKARRLHEVCLDLAAARCEQERTNSLARFESTKTRLDREWKEAVESAEEEREARPKAIDEKAARVTARSERLQRARWEEIERGHEETAASLRRDSEARRKQTQDLHASKMAGLTAEHQSRWQTLEAEWKDSVRPIVVALEAARETTLALFPDWSAPAWNPWTPPERFTNCAPFARLEVDVNELVATAPKDPRLALPLTSPLWLPVVLSYPHQGSLLLETGTTGGEAAVASLNNIMYRLLATTPPGKLSFTILDPVGLGQNFAGVMHLADYEASHINSRIWTQTNQIEERLAELTEHMEKVIQMYLRNEYATIAEYNAEAGTIAEKYHFLVIAGFPVNFSETAARRLLNIAASGARCGVFTLIQWDHRHTLPHDFVPEDLRKPSVCVTATADGFVLAGHPLRGVRLQFDTPPPPELATYLLHEVGRLSKDTNRVEVPFSQVTPGDEELWSSDTAEELRVPIGRAGATKFQYLAIGRGTRQHGLIAGKTGSGKSTLFHVIITNLALWCSPEQVEFYLVDFKKGVEFKCYATHRLPHARVVAIESDRQFGLSVLERVDQELRRRGDLFRHLGVQDLTGYRRADGTEPLPRTLLIIDEFQEFFVEEDRISQNAAVLLDRIVRQGRAFGIHVLLGSQTLGGAYSLARATIGQMVIRVALQCNEADAYLIMDESNAAPRLLSRPGEAIYNDLAGAFEGNSPFQTVWLPENVRGSCLTRARQRAEQGGIPYPAPIVFEGNAPADVRENAVLRALLEAPLRRPAVAARAWLGAPNSIKGPTEVVFQRQTGHNLLVVGQREEAALAILSITLTSLAAQYPLGTARFVLLDGTPPGSPPHEFLTRLLRALPHEVRRPKVGELADTMGELATDLHGRSGDAPPAERPATFLLIHGLQNFKKLRQEDDFSFTSADSGSASPATQLVTLLNEGPSLGLHVILACDAYSNVTRFLGRKALAECALRVLFQMSASDSASLIDDPAASALGLHRALLYNDQEGYLETFRPYALPTQDWIQEVAGLLARRRG